MGERRKKKEKGTVHVQHAGRSSITHLFRNNETVCNGYSLSFVYVVQHNNKHEMRWRKNGRLAILQVWQTKRGGTKIKKNEKKRAKTYCLRVKVRRESVH